MEIVDKYNEHAFTVFKHARFAITYWEKGMGSIDKSYGGMYMYRKQGNMS